MRTRCLLFAVLILTASTARADGKHDALKQASKAIDEMCAAVSQAESQEVADVTGKVAKLEIEKAVGNTSAVVHVKALPGYCHIFVLPQTELEFSFAGVSITRSEGGFYGRSQEWIEFTGA